MKYTVDLGTMPKERVKQELDRLMKEMSKSEDPNK